MLHVMDKIYFCHECIGFLCNRRAVSICPTCLTNDLGLIYDPEVYDEPQRQQMFDCATKLVNMIGLVREENRITFEDLPIVELTQCQMTEGRGCAICISDYECGEKVKQLQCAHTFHEDCLRDWLEKNVTCPLCRTHVFQRKWSELRLASIR